MSRLNWPQLLSCLLLWGLLSAGQAQHDTDIIYDEYDEGMQPQSGMWPSGQAPAPQSPPVRPPPPYPQSQPQPQSQSQPWQSRNSDVVYVPRLGSVRGKIGFKMVGNRPINAFLGLRYGTVGTGTARFQKATVQLSGGNTYIDATREPANCPQFPDLSQIAEAEARGENVDDCLTLNVYAPNKTGGAYPVLVFVHGEMLFDGSAEEAQPDYLLEHDVVLVSVNYRLAPFGFLTTLTEDMPGNVALADIHMALEWVQQYIRSFGGDPMQVTLIGQAGGATLAHALSLSGKAQGLFQKLILQSGTALNPYFLDEEPVVTARAFARLAGCGVNMRDVATLNACFDRLSTTELLKLFQRHWEENEPRGLRFTGGFKLVVGDLLGYLPQHPAALITNNAQPTIVGVTKDAGAFIMSRFYNQLTQVRSSNISEYVNVVLRHTTHPRHFLLWKHWALQHIFTDEDARNPTLRNLAQGLLELVNLVLYRGPIIDSIRYTARKTPTFLYCFDYRGQFHRFGHLRSPLPFESDATLSDDSIYISPYPAEVSHLNPDDKRISNTVTAMWVNFAQYNAPNFNAAIWPNVSSEYGPFLRISNTKGNPLELDYHFGEGIPVPNLYPEYFTTTTTTTTTTTRRPYANANYQQPSPPPPYRHYDRNYDPSNVNNANPDHHGANYRNRY